VPSKPKSHPIVSGWKTIALAILAWPAAYVGAYSLSSAWAAFALYHGLCLVAGVYHSRRYGLRASHRLLTRTWVQIALTGIVFWVGTYLLVTFAGVRTGLVDPARIRGAMHAEHAAATVAAVLAVSVYFAIVNPVVEELFWRATVYSRLRAAGWRQEPASIISGILFGSWHWLIVRLFFGPAAALLVTAAIMAAGYVFAHLYERLRSLPALIVIHALVGDIPGLIALAYAMGA